MYLDVYYNIMWGNMFIITESGNAIYLPEEKSFEIIMNGKNSNYHIEVSYDNERKIIKGGFTNESECASYIGKIIKNLYENKLHITKYYG